MSGMCTVTVLRVTVNVIYSTFTVNTDICTVIVSAHCSPKSTVIRYCNKVVCAVACFACGTYVARMRDVHSGGILRWRNVISEDV